MTVAHQATGAIDDSTADGAGALDLVLTGAALNQFRRFRPGRETVHLAGQLGRRPRKLAMRWSDLLREYGRIAVGASALAPTKGDRRFGEPAWTSNPVLRRVLQAYLATAQTAESVVTDADLDYRDDLRVRFLIDNLIDAAAPSNNPLLSPVAWKAAIDSGGTSLLRGAANLARDMAAAPRIPTMVEPSAFEVGETLAVTSGAVVQRTAMFELIQYTPQTDRVRTLPLLIVPPVINKYYAIDLAPGRSLIEYLVSQGQQVFVISWRNPDARHRTWGIDSYGQAILDALDAVLQIADVEQTHLAALCSGGRHRLDARRLPRRNRRNRQGGIPRAGGHRPRPVPGRHGQRLDRRAGRQDGRRPPRPAAAISTADRSPKCSPGCDPTTSSGTTGSTTTCKESRLRRSTSSTGTPTPPAWPPASTGTSSTWR